MRGVSLGDHTESLNMGPLWTGRLSGWPPHLDPPPGGALLVLTDARAGGEGRGLTPLGCGRCSTLEKRRPTYFSRDPVQMGLLDPGCPQKGPGRNRLNVRGVSQPLAPGHLPATTSLGPRHQPLWVGWAEISIRGDSNLALPPMSRYESPVGLGASGPLSTITKGPRDQRLLELFPKRKMTRSLGSILQGGRPVILRASWVGVSLAKGGSC